MSGRADATGAVHRVFGGRCAGARESEMELFGSPIFLVPYLLAVSIPRRCALADGRSPPAGAGNVPGIQCLSHAVGTAATRGCEIARLAYEDESR
jgi:hypothetical protein